MVQKTVRFVIYSVFCTVLLSSCGSSSSSSAYSPDKPSTIIEAVGSALAKAGAGISVSTSARSHTTSMFAFVPYSSLTATNCGTHGEPQIDGNNLSTSDPRYPGLLTFCKMTVNDGSPETVQGAFDMPRALSCAVEAAGIAFDGVAATKTITIDTSCFSAGQLENIGTTSASATVTGSSPASFNSHFDRGVRVEIPDMNVDYSFGTKVDGTTIEFVSMESGSATRTGAFAGSFDTSSGLLRYEGRMERINCTSSGSCGWNRHIRIYADLTVVNDEPSALESVSFGYANVSAPPGQNGYSGEVVSASGDPNSGIKARAWWATDGSGESPTAATQYDTVANWVEVANTYCYTAASETASGCGNGVGLFSGNTNFLLNDNSHKSTAYFAENYAGMTFTAVDLSVDIQP